MGTSTNARQRRYWAIVRKYQLLVALGLTLMTEILIIPLTRDPVPNLLASPLTFAVMLLATRLSIRFWDDQAGGFSSGTTLAEPVEPASVPRNGSSRMWSRVAKFGLALCAFVLVVTLLVWGVGPKRHARLDGLAAILLTLTALNATLFLFGLSDRRAGRRMRLASSSEERERIGRSLSWIAVSTALLPTLIGCVLFLIDSSVWQLASFMLVSAFFWLACLRRLRQVVSSSSRSAS
jgi:hypothetical protein